MSGPAALAWVFIRRDLGIARSYRFPFALQLVTSAGILLVVNRVSGLVDTGRSSDAALRAGYFTYVLVGMAVLQFVNAALMAFTHKLREEQITGTFEALLTTPASPAALALSMAAYEVLQGVIGCFVLLGLGPAFGANYEASVSGLLASAAALVGLVAMAAAVGIAVSAFTVVFKRGSTVAGLVSAVVALVAGVYFPIAELPGSVRWIAEAIPFTWGISALRSGLLLGDVDGLRILGTLGAAVLALPLALVVFRRSVDRARRQGTLGQY
ncbi:MAG: type transport system permease protein [Pseudonocardiales bacterium]|nr:type transport system permease protein [Pseudonocardiales bacterium]